MHFWRLVLRLMLFAGAVTSAGSALAAVEITFYSREFGINNFPHAFVTLQGHLDSDGRVIDESYGFTAKAISPAILAGSVGGKVIQETPGYIARSDKQFSLLLNDDAYYSVVRVVDAWRSRPQPSYNLNKSNCVHFVGELAQAAGLKVTFPPKLMKKPRAFLAEVRVSNSAQIVAP